MTLFWGGTNGDIARAGGGPANVPGGGPARIGGGLIGLFAEYCAWLCAGGGGGG